MTAGLTKLVTLQQASKETGVPYTTLRDLVLRGLLPCVRLGDTRRLWIKARDLELLIHRSTGTGE